MSRLWVSFALAFVLHGALAAGALSFHHAKTLEAAPDDPPQEVDVEPERTRDPEPAPITEEKSTEVAHVVQSRTTSHIEARTEAPQILARNQENEAVSFGDDVFVTGHGEELAHGPTASHATEGRAAAATSTPVMRVAAPELTRTAELRSRGEWKCPFPPEADTDQVDRAAAVVEVTVGADGKAQRSVVLEDPGHGFGRAAQSCAMHEQYVAAQGRDGNLVASSRKFRVKFER